jgi:hypothetical protein
MFCRDKIELMGDFFQTEKKCPERAKGLKVPSEISPG